MKIFPIVKKLILLTLFFIVTYFPNVLASEKSNYNLSNIYSKNYLVFDRNSSTTILDKNGFEKTPMASTTKIMTCILAIENGNLKDIVKTSKSVNKVTGSKINLKENYTITLEDLLYGLMLRSGNDAAIVIAEHISGNLDNFLKLMNQKAKELNLLNTQFTSPHGLDNENHYTTCYDLAILTNYALNNPTFKKIVSTNITSISINNQLTSIHNTNNLLRDTTGFYGVKTGFTFNAGRCLVSAYKNNDIDIIIVTLNANTNNQRAKDHVLLKNYILENYKSISLKTDIYTSFNNFLNQNEELYFKSIPNSNIILDESINDIDKFLIGNNSTINFKINIIPILSYNNFVGEKIGTFNIYENNNLKKTIDIILSSEIKKLDFNFYFNYLFKSLI